jgi:hypothetical protein
MIMLGRSSSNYRSFRSKNELPKIHNKSQTDLLQADLLPALKGEGSRKDGEKVS